MPAESAPRRLLVVTDEMEVGGSQRQITRLLSGLDRSRWQPELLYFRQRSFLVDQLEAQGIPVHHLPKRGRIDPGFVLRYAALLRSGRYDLVHAFSLTAELWTLIASLLGVSRARRVASVRGLYLDMPAWFWRIKRVLLRSSAAVISNSKAGAEAASARSGVPLAKIDVVPNGIVIPDEADAEAKQRTRQALAVAQERVLALYVGRLVEAKNIPCLLRAMSRLPLAQRPLLLLAGDGPLRAALLRQADALALGADVRFLGERDDTLVLMQAADFTVLPSRYEGMSNVVMEAMASGCPVIASNVGGNPELIENGQDGALFDTDDDAMLAELIQRFTTNASLRQRLGRQARATMQARYSIPALVAATTAIYERCLRRQSPLKTGAPQEQRA
jgi:glycosyltransferase involved in cell wall biosynthesis